MIKNYTACIIGVTGLVGKALLNEILQDNSYTTIHLLLRKENKTIPKDSRIQTHIVDFKEYDSWKSKIVGDQIFCTIGTTIKQAKTKEAFYKIDHDLVLQIATAAKQNNAKHLLVISAMGANKKSRIFYSKTKGDMEYDLQQVGLPQITILRPSILGGKRIEFRFAEKIGIAVGRVLPKRYRTIEPERVARAMLIAAQNFTEPLTILESDKLQDLGI